MKFRKSIVSLLGVALLTTACSSGNGPETEGGPEDGAEVGENFNATGFPIVNDPISLDIFISKRADNLSDLNNVSGLQLYEEMTNININWDQIEADALVEKRNFAIAGGNLPDVFYGAKFSNLEIFELAQQGIIMDLTDLIDQYAPNLTGLMEEYPEIRQAITFPDGKIYSIPYLIDPEFTQHHLDPTLYFNQDWLAELGMDTPKTTDEFYEYLKAVKGQDLNGNGIDDEIPYGGNGIDSLIRWLRGSFNTQNKANDYIEQDLKQPDQVRFAPITEEYKEMLEYFHKLYNEGLIEQTIFSIEQNQFMANGAEDLYGSTVWYNPNNMFFSKVKEPFEQGVPLIGPHGDAALVFGSPVYDAGQFVVTNENKYPAETIRWVDYFYSTEGALLTFLGIEDLSYVKIGEGEYDTTDEISNNPNGLASYEATAQHAYYRSVQGVAAYLKKGTMKVNPEAEERGRMVEPFVPEERGWPEFTYTVEENRRLAPLSDDIETYVDEMKIKFIAGETPFSQWDQYVETLHNMGLNDYLEIQQAAYERYEAAGS